MWHDAFKYFMSYLFLLKMRNQFGEETDQMEQNNYSPVKISAVASPQLPGLQGALARPHLLDRPPEDGHDITEVHCRSCTVGILIH